MNNHDLRRNTEQAVRFTPATLGLADDIREALLDLGCSNGDLSHTGQWLPVRFKAVYDTCRGGYSIFQIDQERTPRAFLRHLSQHPDVTYRLAKRLGKPIRLVCECNGEMKLVVGHRSNGYCTVVT